MDRDAQSVLKRTPVPMLKKSGVSNYHEGKVRFILSAMGALYLPGGDAMWRTTMTMAERFPNGDDPMMKHIFFVQSARNTDVDFEHFQPGQHVVSLVRTLSIKYNLSVTGHAQSVRNTGLSGGILQDGETPKRICHECQYLFDTQ